MKVLMVSDVYFPRINGVSTSIQTFTACLAELGVEVRLIAPSYEGQVPAAHIVRIPARRVPLDPEDRLMNYARLVAHVDSLQPGEVDVVHIQTPFLAHYAGVRLARRLGVPALATYHTFFEEYLHHYVPALQKNWMRGLARRISCGQCNALDAVVVPSSAMRDRLAAYGVTAPMHVLPTGIPLGNFSSGDRAGFRAAYGIAPNAKVALFVGRLAHEKNIEFLLEAAAHAKMKLPQLVWLITGEGPAQPRLKRRVEQLGLNEQVRFLGYLDRSRALIDCYAAADVFAFSSLTETQGLVLLEAMALGVPAVALSAMGTADILAPRLGAVVPEPYPERFAEDLVALLCDPARHARLAAEARDYAKQWSDVAMAERLALLYREVARGRAEGGLTSRLARATRPPLAAQR